MTNTSASRPLEVQINSNRSPIDDQLAIRETGLSHTSPLYCPCFATRQFTLTLAHKQRTRSSSRAELNVKPGPAPAPAQPVSPDWSRSVGAATPIATLSVCLSVCQPSAPCVSPQPIAQPAPRELPLCQVVLLTRLLHDRLKPLLACAMRMPLLSRSRSRSPPWYSSIDHPLASLPLSITLPPRLANQRPNQLAPCLPPPQSLATSRFPLRFPFLSLTLPPLVRGPVFYSVTFSFRRSNEPMNLRIFPPGPNPRAGVVAASDLLGNGQSFGNRLSE